MKKIQIYNHKNRHHYNQALYNVDIENIPLFNIKNQKYVEILGDKHIIKNSKNIFNNFDNTQRIVGKEAKKKYILTLKNQEFYETLKIFSFKYNKNFCGISSIEGIPKDAESIIFVESYNILNDNFVSRLRNYCEDLNIKLGIIPFDDLTDLSFSLAKLFIGKEYLKYIHEENYLSLLYGIDYKINTNHNVMNRKDIDNSNLGELLSTEYYNFLNIFSHGHDDRIFLGDINIKNKGEVSPAQIHSFLLMSNSCMSYKFISTSFNNELISKQFINSDIISYIGTNRVKEGAYFENIFVFCLIKEGFSFGETVTLLNKLLTNSLLDTPSYILYGDPDFRFKQSKENYIKKININHNSQYKIPFSSKENYFFTEIDDELWVFNGNILEENSFDFGKVPLNIVSQQKKIISTYYVNRYKKIYTNKIKGKINEIENNMKFLSNSLPKLYYSNYIYKKFIEVINKNNNLIFNIQNDILDSLVSDIKRGKNRYWENFLYDTTLQSYEEIINGCKYCNGVIIKKRISNLIHNTTHYNSFCNSCGFIEDSDYRKELEVFISEYDYKEEKLFITIKNLTNHRKKLNCRIFLDTNHDLYGQNYYIIPQEINADIWNNKVINLELDVKIEEKGKYFVRFLIMDSLNIEIFSRPLLVRRLDNA